nr:helix-turn-helix domain-containing protein [Treponema sp.]
SLILSITHDEIAREIASVREVVTKTLKYLSQEGLVRLGRGKIEILDRQRLMNLI